MAITKEMEQIRQNLLRRFFQPSSLPVRGVNAIGIGVVPPDPEAPRFLVFVDPAASCELDQIDREVKAIAGPAYKLLFAPKFTALQAPATPPAVLSGFSIAPYDPYRYNIPPVSAGTLGTKVKAPNGTYVLSCNHVVACNGRVPKDTPIYCPGPKGDRSVDSWNDVWPGQVVAARSEFVPFKSPGWPWKPLANVNTVDCALAEVAPGATLTLGTRCKVLPALTAVTDVHKTGRTTGLTNAFIRIWSLAGWINFSFGIFFFDQMLATFEEAPTVPPIVPYTPPGTRPVFAAPGDSGAMVLDNSDRGVGLVMARGYCFSSPPPAPASGTLTGVLIAICSLDLVAEGLANVLNVNKADLQFFI
ncbi:MAG TPA: hypothetical protein VIX89_08705 [Bryobacteraceae bacterium]